MGLARLLMLVGGALLFLGVVLWIASRVPGLDRLGRLPGDIVYRGRGISFHFPLATSLLLSVLLSLLLSLVVSSTGCKKKEKVDPEKIRMEGQIQQMEKEHAEYEKKIAEASNDPGLKNKLSEDRELLKSRIERLKEILKRQH